MSTGSKPGAAMPLSFDDEHDAAGAGDAGTSAAGEVGNVAGEIGALHDRLTSLSGELRGRIAETEALIATLSRPSHAG